MAVRTRSPFVPIYGAGHPGWAQTARGARRFGFPFRLLIVLALLPLLLGLSLLVAYRQQQTDRIYPGVSVFGVDVGRMTRDQAARAIKARIVDYSQRPFLLRYDDDGLSTTLAKIGLVIDDEALGALADEALAVGRDGSTGDWIRSQLKLMRSGQTVPAGLRVDPDRAAAVLGSVSSSVERQTLNANLEVQKVGERFEIHTSPAHIGRRLNVPATIDRLQTALASGLPNTLDLVLDEARPTINDEDVVPAAQRAEAILSAALDLRDGSRTWRVEPAAAYAMLEIRGLDTGQPPITVGLNEAKLRDFVVKAARAADQTARNPTFAIDGDQVVVRPGAAGRLAKADETFEQLKQIVGTEQRSVDMVFEEDRPWLTEADLEPARAVANAVLDLPLVLEAPPGSLAVQSSLANILGTPTAGQSGSGTPGPAPTPTPIPGAAAQPPALPTGKPSEGVWVLGRAQLLQLIALPNTQSAPRDYAQLQPAQRPRFELSLDSAKVNNFIQREVAPVVSIDPIDAELSLTRSTIDVPNPAYAAAVATATRQAASAAGPTPTPGPISVPAMLSEPVYRVELRNAKDGRGPDLAGTYANLQALFRAGLSSIPVPPGPPPVPPAAATAAAAAAATQAAAGVTATPTRVATPTPVPTVVAVAPPTELMERRATLRLAPRPPRVQDRDLAAARDLANFLIAEPITLRWNDASWTVSRADLTDMLRYQQAGGGLTAYLTRDGLLAKAEAIAREAERRPDAPRDSKGQVLPLDVPRTAAAIWQQASTVPANRSAEIVWTEEEITPPATAPGA